MLSEIQWMAGKYSLVCGDRTAHVAAHRLYPAIFCSSGLNSFRRPMCQLCFCRGDTQAAGKWVYPGTMELILAWRGFPWEAHKGRRAAGPTMGAMRSKRNLQDLPDAEVVPQFFRMHRRSGHKCALGIFLCKYTCVDVPFFWKQPDMTILRGLRGRYIHPNVYYAGGGCNMELEKINTKQHKKETQTDSTHTQRQTQDITFCIWYP